MIRHATQGDIPAIADMCEVFHKASGIGKIRSCCRDTVVEIIKHLINGDNGEIYVTDEGDGLTGMAMVTLFPCWYNKQHLIAQELAWWVMPGKRMKAHGAKLFRAIEKWSVEKGAKTITMISLENLSPSKIRKMYEKRGFEMSEHIFVRKANGT